MKNKGTKDNSRRLSRLILAALMTAAFVLSAFPALAAPAIAETDGAGETAAQAEQGAVVSKKALDLVDDSELKGISKIPLTYYDVSDHVYTWEFPYTDDFFHHPSNQFSVTMAQGSLGLAISSFRNDEANYTPGYEKFFAKAGFSQVESFGYDKPTTTDSISVAIASKKIDGMTVIAAVSCSAGYGKEWASNFLVGDGVRHEGFENGAKKMEKIIGDYIRDHQIKGKKKLWLGGHSRAAGIANITAADMIESGEFEDVYAYLSGVPRTTRSPVNYPGIYNICGQADVVPGVPLPEWGFERYGTDLYTPSQSTSSNYSDLAGAASTVCLDLTGDIFRNDPRLAYQYHLIMSFMGDFFPTAADYAEEFQGILMETWTDPARENIFMLLASAMSRMKTLNAQEKKASRFFIEYLSSIMDNAPQIKDGTWVESDNVADNMMREHRSITYISWMFADRDPVEICEGPTLYRRVILIGDMDLEVYLGNTLIGRVKKNGKTYMLYDDLDDPRSYDAPCPYLLRTGKQTVAHLPQDETYTLRVIQPKTTNLTYYDLTYDAYDPQDQAEYIYAGAPKKGTYEMRVVPGESLPELTSLSTGQDAAMIQSPYTYSPITEMQMETDSMRYGLFTVDQMVSLLLAVLAGLALLPIACIIIAARHRAGRRRGHPAYSNWYVIVPHLLVIFTFTVLTVLFSWYLVSYGKVMMVCIAVVALFLLLLSVRALLRNRNLYTKILSVVFLLLAVCAGIMAYKEPVITNNDLNMVLYVIAVGVCCVLAVLAFYVRPAERRG